MIINNMRKFFITLTALLMATLSVQAQKEIPANIRMTATELEDNNAAYSIFTYKDEDGTFGYYLSLGGSGEFFSVSKNDATTFSISDARETCLWLGATTDEAFAMLDSLQAMYELDEGTVKEFKSRTTNGAERLTDQSITTCIVKKKMIGGKKLLFTFTSGKSECGVYLTKGLIKQLRFGLKTDIKLHPKMHQ